MYLYVIGTLILLFICYNIVILGVLYVDDNISTLIYLNKDIAINGWFNEFKNYGYSNLRCEYALGFLCSPILLIALVFIYFDKDTYKYFKLKHVHFSNRDIYSYDKRIYFMCSPKGGEDPEHVINRIYFEYYQELDFRDEYINVIKQLSLL